MAHNKCPECGGDVTAATQQAGGDLRCPHCGSALSPQGPESAWQENPVPCPFCAELLPLRANDVGMRLSCPRCGRMIHVEQGSAPNSLILVRGRKEAAKASVPWEIRGEYGFWRALWHAVRAVAFSPGRFYRESRLGDAEDAVIFAVVMGVPATLAADLTYGCCGVGFLAPPVHHLLSWNIIVCVPLSVLFHATVVWAISMLGHTALWFMGRARARLDATCSVVGYSYGAVVGLCAVPCAGYAAMLIWLIITVTIGLREVSETTTASALFAVAFSILLASAAAGVLFAMAAVTGVY